MYIYIYICICIYSVGDILCLVTPVKERRRHLYLGLIGGPHTKPRTGREKPHLSTTTGGSKPCIMR